MKKDTFVQSHPLHVFDINDRADYCERNKYFIQCLKAIESVMDIDAYILDYRSQKILYATQNCSLHFGGSSGFKEDSFFGYSYFDKIIHEEDMEMLAAINKETMNFFYTLPIERRLNAHFTHDFRIIGKGNETKFVNQKISVLDLTESGALRFGLFVFSYPTNYKLGKAYIKMNDTSSVYEYFASTKSFVEVKTQKLTSKALEILNLASSGKNEAEIAEILGITIHTVKYHKQKVFSQTGVRNITEAVQWMNNQKKIIKKRN